MDSMLQIGIWNPKLSERTITGGRKYLNTKAAEAKVALEMSLAYELSVNVFTVITCDLVLKVVLNILCFMVALEFKASFKKEILL